MTDEATAILENLKIYFSQKNAVNLALLFGSAIKDTFRDTSDVDIAIDFFAKDENDRLDKWLAMRAELEQLLKREIDLLDLSKLEGLVLSKVMEQNIRIKNNSSLYADYNLKAIYFNEDFLPTLREIQSKRIKRFVNG